MKRVIALLLALLMAAGLPLPKQIYGHGWLVIDNEKMSKSKHNFFTVRDILKEFDGETVRFFILQTHYRSPLDFSAERLQEAKTSLGRLKAAKNSLTELAEKTAEQGEAGALAGAAAKHFAAFYEAMEDDFNTALAIGEMFALAKEINIYCRDVAERGVHPARADVDKAAAAYDEMAEVIGIFEQDEAAAFCRAEGVRHEIIDSCELDIPGFAENPPDRCYLCKKAIFGEIGALARAFGLAAVVECRLRVAAPGVIAFGFPIQHSGAMLRNSLRLENQVGEEAPARGRIGPVHAHLADYRLLPELGIQRIDIVDYLLIVSLPTALFRI